MNIGNYGGRCPFLILYSDTEEGHRSFFDDTTKGGELSPSESASFLKFIKSVDPQNVLGNHLDEFLGNPCLYEGEGVKCNLQGTSIEKIRVENLNLSGGEITLNSERNMDSKFKPSAAADPSKVDSKENQKWLNSIPLVLGIGLFCVFIYVVGLKVTRQKEIQRAIRQKANLDSPLKMPPGMEVEEGRAEESRSQLVFLVEEDQRFKLEDLLEATADLRGESISSWLYQVQLKDNVTYAVKRLKKLRVSIEEFGETMREIGNMKHPNILLLVAYKSTDEEKLLIYHYQSNGSLLNFLESSIEGRRDFPWRLRLSIASGIARGLAFIYQRLDEKESIPRGNIKLSNIQLDDNMEPLISEYGISRFLDPKKNSLFSFHVYSAPEKSFTEKGDVYSFGVILLELLTGKNVEKTGIDLPKWVRSMVREEWTGEVFDKEVNRDAIQWAFPLLNIALKCT
ncbi:hypothetical protein SLEP1_g51075 [Rubroshorea leprosula]|uniref:Protein kinase domain-containing protein n=1 Tax=Rubroshorea leprosula TaxID=152421 RepID=A0AAV5M203_9ROSI|nr:hypothetical protein SLEP1_g51075 [Rubroshorea leprosula]